MMNSLLDLICISGAYRILLTEFFLSFQLSAVFQTKNYFLRSLSCTEVETSSFTCIIKLHSLQLYFTFLFSIQFCNFFFSFHGLLLCSSKKSTLWLLNNKQAVGGPSLNRMIILLSITKFQFRNENLFFKLPRNEWWYHYLIDCVILFSRQLDQLLDISISIKRKWRDVA